MHVSSDNSTPVELGEGEGKERGGEKGGRKIFREERGPRDEAFKDSKIKNKYYQLSKGVVVIVSSAISSNPLTSGTTVVDNCYDI